MLPYYLANPTLTYIYYYTFELELATSTANRVDASTVSYSTANSIGYNQLSSS